jgi:hypothetical protein
MLSIVYLQEENDDYPTMVAAFLMKSDAEMFVRHSSLRYQYKIKNTSSEAWTSWSKIRKEI